MDSNLTSDNSKGIRGIISIAGLVILIIGMLLSVQTENYLIPTVMMITGTLIILVAERATLDER